MIDSFFDIIEQQPQQGVPQGVEDPLKEGVQPILMFEMGFGGGSEQGTLARTNLSAKLRFLL